jgi:hypothetical protein
MNEEDRQACTKIADQILAEGPLVLKPEEVAAFVQWVVAEYNRATLKDTIPY